MKEKKEKREINNGLNRKSGAKRGPACQGIVGGILSLGPRRGSFRPRGARRFLHRYLCNLAT